ncbi:hypothetical protein Rhow_002441 [Rhodococcus wratislaviensis]|uniref:Uncharacterized protein n=1 Tax=Rhodococcus wratislaviensis TaxID=44752 RepID=A0A402C5U5_RHOWR|nr:hypothetical protein Rhow_002441 [Rhodococcus wratislaviensis]
MTAPPFRTPRRTVRNTLASARTVHRLDSAPPESNRHDRAPAE